MPTLPAGYTAIPQSITGTVPPQGYILTTQSIGMQHNPNLIPSTFLPQPMPLVQAGGGLPFYSNHPQIVTSSQGGGVPTYQTYIQHPMQQQQPQTFVVRSNYDFSNGFIPSSNLPPQQQQYQQQPQQQQFQYAPIQIQQYQGQPPQQMQYHIQPQPQQQQYVTTQLPYSQPNNNGGIRRFGPN
jgi:hypothetical protein